MKIAVSLCPSQHLLFIIARLVVMKWCLVVLICVFLIVNDSKHPLIYALCTILESSFMFEHHFGNCKETGIYIYLTTETREESIRVHTCLFIKRFHKQICMVENRPLRETPEFSSHIKPELVCGGS
jgi:hypothetical protein